VGSASRVVDSRRQRPERLSPCYVFPVQPPSVATYQQGHHDYPAIDIFAPFRAKYVAVTQGRIERVRRVDRWTPEIDAPGARGGLFVSFVGDDGVRYYGSHLISVAGGLEAGVRVRVGQRLGRVGNTGNARGISPHLHFGISRPTYPGDWRVRRGHIDPFTYVQAWRRGQCRQPDLGTKGS